MNKLTFCNGCGINRLTAFHEKLVSFECCHHVFHVNCYDEIIYKIDCVDVYCPICDYPDDLHPGVSKDHILFKYLHFNLDSLTDMLLRPHFSYYHLSSIFQYANPGDVFDFSGIYADNSFQEPDIQLIHNQRRVKIRFDHRGDMIIPCLYLKSNIDAYDAMSSYLRCYISGC